MLVVTRKRGEKVLIGDNIAVTITEIRGDKIRLGIEAPKEIKIRREEISTKAKVKEESNPEVSAPPLGS